MKKYTYPLLAITGGLLLTGCNGGDSSSSPEAATFSLAVSDAPVDDVSEVVLAFEDVVLIPFNPETGEKTGDPIIMNVSENGELKKIDLMQYQGSNAETIISEQTIAPGNYAMCLYAKDGEEASDLYSYVTTTNGNLKGLKVTNRGNCYSFKHDTSDQGPLVFSDRGKGEYVKVHTGHNSYVLEFDLRQALAPANGKDHMNMSRNGVTLVNASEAGHIGGQLSQEQYDNCVVDSNSLNGLTTDPIVHSVYLYAGNVDLSAMGDVGAPEPFVTPVATANVNQTTDELGNTTYNYEFGYIGPGAYTIGYTCTAANDEPTSHQTADDGFMIYQDYSPVEVMEGEYTTQDLEVVVEDIDTPEEVVEVK